MSGERTPKEICLRAAIQKTGKYDADETWEWRQIVPDTSMVKQQRSPTVDSRIRRTDV